MTAPSDQPEPASDESIVVNEPRLWVQRGWTARVIKNEDDDGWAVEMTLAGQSEPALVGPWTMGRDKKNPKPLDSTAFNTLVKTASEVVLRHEQHLKALMHQNIMVAVADRQIQISLDVVADEDDPHALLSAHDPDGEQLAKIRVRPDFKLNSTTARAWVESRYSNPK